MRDIVLDDTIYIRFTTRAFATGIPTTLAGTPVLSIYEENNLTQITAGVSVTVDYDSVTGLNQVTIVATSANGYEAGKSYDLVITTGTVDSVSVVGESVGSFTVGLLVSKIDDMQGAGFLTATDSLEAIRDRGDSSWVTGGGGSDRLLMIDTTIATLSSQTSFTLTSGSSDDDAYNNCTIIIEDVAASVQKAFGIVSDYVGSTKTVTLKYDPAIFTMATTDKIYILAENSLKATAANRQLSVEADGDLTKVNLCDTNTDMRGTDGANTVVPDVAGTAPTAIENRQEMDSNSTSLIAILADTGELQADDVPGLIAALNNLSSADILTTALTESYAADGATATLSQLLYMVWSMMNSLGFITLTGTSRKLDGSTPAMTFTIDDADNPTDINRET